MKGDNVNYFLSSKWHFKTVKRTLNPGHFLATIDQKVRLSINNVKKN